MFFFSALVIDILEFYNSTYLFYFLPLPLVLQEGKDFCQFLSKLLLLQCLEQCLGLAIFGKKSQVYNKKDERKCAKIITTQEFLQPGKKYLVPDRLTNT